MAGAWSWSLLTFKLLHIGCRGFSPVLERGRGLKQITLTLKLLDIACCIFPPVKNRGRSLKLMFHLYSSHTYWLPTFLTRGRKGPELEADNSHIQVPTHWLMTLLTCGRKWLELQAEDLLTFKLLHTGCWIFLFMEKVVVPRSCRLTYIQAPTHWMLRIFTCDRKGRSLKMITLTFTFTTLGGKSSTCVKNGPELEAEVSFKFKLLHIACWIFLPVVKSRRSLKMRTYLHKLLHVACLVFPTVEK